MQSYRKWIALTLIAIPASLAQSYILTDLGPGSARDVNASGTVVGNGTNNHSFIYRGAVRSEIEIWARSSGLPPEFPSTRYDRLSATAINDSGIVVGSLMVAPGGISIPEISTGFYWNSSVTNAVLLSGGTFSGAETLYSINNNGTAAGFKPASTGGVGPGPLHPLLFDGINIQPLGPTIDAPFQVFGINSGGTVVGSWNGGAAIFTSTGPTLINLGNIPEVVGPNGAARAYAVNSAGQIAGSYTGGHTPNPSDPNPNTRAFIHSTAGTQLLPALDGPDTDARDINDQSEIVGWAIVGSGETHATLWKNGVATDLNTEISSGTGWLLVYANAINESGQIVGEGLLNGEQRAFLLTPATPGNEPPEFTLLPVGGSVALGGSITLSAAASGAAPLSFQWSHAGTNLIGATNLTLVITNATAFNAGEYRVTVSNSVSSITSAPVTVSVLDPVVAIQNVALVWVTGTVGADYRVEFVGSLGSTDWSAITTVTLTNSPQAVLDLASATNSPRYYRAVRLP